MRSAVSLASFTTALCLFWNVSTLILFMVVDLCLDVLGLGVPCRCFLGTIA